MYDCIDELMNRETDRQAEDGWMDGLASEMEGGRDVSVGELAGAHSERGGNRCHNIP